MVKIDTLSKYISLLQNCSIVSSDPEQNENMIIIIIMRYIFMHNYKAHNVLNGNNSKNICRFLKKIGRILFRPFSSKFKKIYTHIIRHYGLIRYYNIYLNCIVLLRIFIQDSLFSPHVELLSMRVLRRRS